MNADVELKQTNLPIGDFVVSERVAIERKTIDDFKQTLIRGDLFDQLKSLKIAYQKPLLLIEGDDVYQAGLHPAAIRGAIASILIDYSIPILFCKDEEDTVKILISIAKREQREKSNRPQIRADKPTGSMEDEQIYLISSLPNIDRILAERILDHFSTPRAVFNANQDDLRKVYGIGPQIADRIDILLSSPFREDE
jgi:Fanconi anemia group M protein